MFAEWKAKNPFFGPLGSDYRTEWARTRWARVIRFAMLETITRPIIKFLAHPTSISRDRLDHVNTPVIFAVNHSSHIDTSLVMTALPRRIRDRVLVAAGSDYFFDKHWKAALWSLWMGIIPLERDKVSRASIEIAANLLADGWSLVIFPEGTRGDTDFTVPFKPGAAFLSIRSGMPVVPVHLNGTRRIFTPYTHHLRIGRTRVAFGAPLYPKQGERARDFNVRVEAAVAAAADESRTDWWSALRRSAAGTTPSLRGPEDVTGWRRHWAASAGRPHQSAKAWPNG